MSIYTWTNNRWAQFATRIVSSTTREATVVLDGILDNAVKFRHEERSNDTTGWTWFLRPPWDAVRHQTA